MMLLITTSLKIANTMDKTFLHLFSYERVDSGLPNENSVFVNCTILKSFGRYTVGDKVPHIGAQVTLYLWPTEEDYDEETIIL